MTTPGRVALGNKHYVLLILLVTYAFSMVDRQILAVMMEPIRKELRLSDSQLGIVSGLAFGLLYGTMGIPLARIGDRWSRRGLIAICFAAWSLATGACGLAMTFTQLFAARVCVGVGEAGAGPASHSLIADYFPAGRRGTAFGIYATGVYIGSALGLMLGGALYRLIGWRGAFLAMALPGLLMAVVLRLTVREPVRGAMDPVAPDQPVLALRPSIAVIARNPTLVLVAFGLGFSVFSVQAMLNWFPTYLVRTYGASPTSAAGLIGPIVGICGVLGLLLGGWGADALGRIHPKHVPQFLATAVLLSIPAGVGCLFVPPGPFLVAWTCFFFLLTATAGGPSLALIQNAAPVRLRAFAAAFAGLIAVVLGSALGPFTVGFSSDVLQHAAVGQPLRWSLALCVSVSALGVVAYLFAASTIKDRPDKLAGFAAPLNSARPA